MAHEKIFTPGPPKPLIRTPIFFHYEIILTLSIPTNSLLNRL